MPLKVLGVTSGVTNAQISSCTSESKTTKRGSQGSSPGALLTTSASFPKKFHLGAWEESLGGGGALVGTTGLQVHMLPLRAAFSIHERPIWGTKRPSLFELMATQRVLCVLPGTISFTLFQTTNLGVGGSNPSGRATSVQNWARQIPPFLRLKRRRACAAVRFWSP
jgi:hypothetical protein